MAPHRWRLILGIVAVLTAQCALCPPKCECDDTTLSAKCNSAMFDVIPIQFNPEVQVIALVNNKINDTRFTLAIYSNLVELNLAQNRLKTLGTGNFASQHHLTHLNLSRNIIEKLHKKTFQGLKTLTHLDLSYNHLEEVDAETFTDLHSLERLTFAHNRLYSLQDGVFRFCKRLKVLDLDHNSFLNVPSGALVNASILSELSMSYNLLESIGEVPALTDLRSLSLANNLINDIRPLDSLTSLDSLDLSDNRFTQIPSLEKLSNITSLKFSGNLIEKVPAVAFKGLFQLRQLELDRQTTLATLDSRAFIDNINLERVWLDDNVAVERLPARLFVGNPRVTHVSVRNNRLSTVASATFPIEQLKSLTLAGNPLECNCSVHWLWQLRHENRTGLVVDDVMCAGPVHLAAKHLSDLAQSDVDCSVGWITIVAVTCTILILCTILGGALYWVRTVVLKKRADSIARRDVLRPDAEDADKKFVNDYRTLPCSMYYRTNIVYV